MWLSAFIKTPLPVPPSGLSDITSSFNITAGQYDKFLWPCIRNPIVDSIDVVLTGLFALTFSIKDL